MALDHAHEGIRINGICPGYMRTAMTTGFSEKPEVEADLCGRIPQGEQSDRWKAARTAKNSHVLVSRPPAQHG